MEKFRILLPIMLLFSLMGLQLLPNNDGQNESNKSLATEKRSNLIPGFTNTVKVELTELGTMKASWYGPRFHGRYTANGEKYDQEGYTAAHKNLPFGTLLKLTNEENNKSVVVRINDRGPYIPGRQIDLSKRAATELDSYHKGVVKLKVEKIKISGIGSPLIN
jgi:rare lipoprotein A